MEEKKVFYDCSHPECGRRFTLQQDLTSHIERRHKAIQESKEKVMKVRIVKKEIDYKELLLNNGMYESLEDVDQLIATNKHINIFEPHKHLDISIMSNIRVMTLSYNQIKEIEFLQFFPNLEELNINNNLIENIWFLS